MLFSQQTTIQLVDKINEAHAWEIEDMKQSVETMLRTSNTNREKRALATSGAFGFSMFGDNVGKVINPRCVLFVSVIVKIRIKVKLQKNINKH